MEKRNGKILTEKDEIGELPPRATHGFAHSSSLSRTVDQACNEFFRKRGIAPPETWRRGREAKRKAA